MYGKQVMGCLSSQSPRDLIIEFGCLDQGWTLDPHKADQKVSPGN